MRVSFRIRLVQPWLHSGVPAAVGVRVLAYRRHEGQIGANACAVEAFYVSGVVEVAPGAFDARRRFFSRARTHA